MSGKFMMNGVEYLGGGSGGGGGNVDDVLVNGLSVVNENKEAEIVSYKEVTLAEYQALPDSKLTDNVMYCIKDIGGANQFPPLIYSDEEREIGVWRDGRPLYQKSFNITDNIGASFTVNHNISNLDYIIDAEGSVLYNSSDKYAEPLSPGNEVTIGWGNAIADISRTTFSIFIGSARASSVGVVAVNVTLRYVKTTDTPGSGTWTTDGTYAHHYSTSEKVIGTWIDGKPLYEKVVEKTCSFTTQSDISGVIYGSDISLATEIPNIDMAWFIKDKSYYIVNNSTRGFYNGWYENNSGTFYIQTLYSRSNVACKFVIQYTKTTD